VPLVGDPQAGEGAFHHHLSAVVVLEKDHVARNTAAQRALAGPRTNAAGGGQAGDECRVAVMVWGGSYFAPASDEGFVLQVGALTPTSNFAVDAGTWTQGARWEEGSTAPSSVGNATQCLEVLAASAPAWSTVAVTISYGQYWFGQILALAFYPVLEPAV